MELELTEENKMKDYKTLETQVTRLRTNNDIAWLQENICNYKSVSIKIFVLELSVIMKIANILSSQLQLRELEMQVQSFLDSQQNHTLLLIQSIQPLQSLKKFSFRMYLTLSDIQFQEIGMALHTLLKHLPELKQLELSCENEFDGQINEEGIIDINKGIQSLKQLTSLSITLAVINNIEHQRTVSLMLNNIGTLSQLQHLKLLISEQDDAEDNHFMDLGFNTANLSNLTKLDIEVTSGFRLCNMVSLNLYTSLLRIRSLRVLRLQISEEVSVDQINEVLNKISLLENLEEVDFGICYLNSKHESSRIVTINNPLESLSLLTKLQINLIQAQYSMKNSFAFGNGMEQLSSLTKLSIKLDQFYLLEETEQNCFVQSLRNYKQLRVLYILSTSEISLKYFNEIVEAVSKLNVIKDFKIKFSPNYDEQQNQDIMKTLDKVKHIQNFRLSYFIEISGYSTNSEKQQLNRINNNPILSQEIYPSQQKENITEFPDIKTLVVNLQGNSRSPILFSQFIKNLEKFPNLCELEIRLLVTKDLEQKYVVEFLNKIIESKKLKSLMLQCTKTCLQPLQTKFLEQLSQLTTLNTLKLYFQLQYLKRKIYKRNNRLVEFQTFF